MADLLERLESPGAEQRIEALRAAARLEGEALDAIGALPRIVLKRLLDPEPRVVHAALEALAQLAYRDAARFEGLEPVRAVLALIANENPAVRAELAVALAVLPPDPAHPIAATLLRLLDDPVILVRREAAAALGDFGDRAAVEPLARHLEDEDLDTRFEAAFALAALGDPRGVPVLIGALGTGTRRLDACDAFKRLGDRAAVPALRRAVKGIFVGWPERLSLWATLYSLGEQEGAERVIERTRAWSRQERGLALALIGTHRITEGLAVLTKVALTAKDPLQGTAVRALGELGAVETLTTIAGDASHPEDVRADAKDALERLAVPDPERRTAP